MLMLHYNWPVMRASISSTEMDGGVGRREIADNRWLARVKQAYQEDHDNDERERARKIGDEFPMRMRETPSLLRTTTCAAHAAQHISRPRPPLL